MREHPFLLATMNLLTLDGGRIAIFRCRRVLARTNADGRVPALSGAEGTPVATSLSHYLEKEKVQKKAPVSRRGVPECKEDYLLSSVPVAPSSRREATVRTVRAAMGATPAAVL